MKTLIVSDYDGTLKTNKLETLKKSVEILKMLSSDQNKIMISTGRLYKSITQEISENYIPFNYISCANGNLLFDENFEIIFKTHVDSKIIKQLKPFYAQILEIESLDEFGSLTSNYPTEYLIHIIDDLNVRRQIVNMLFSSKNFDYCTDGDNKFSIHIFNLSNKLKTIEIVKKILHLRNDEIFAIGDGYNDLEMLKKYNGYIVGHNDEILTEIDGIRSFETFEKCAEDIQHTLTLKRGRK